MPSSWRLLFATEGTVALPALSLRSPASDRIRAFPRNDKNNGYAAQRVEHSLRLHTRDYYYCLSLFRAKLHYGFHLYTRRTLRACSVLVAEKTIPREEMPVHSFRVMLPLVVCTYVRRIPERSVVVFVECTDWGMFVRESTRRVVVCQKARAYRVYNNIVYIYTVRHSGGLNFAR